MIYDAVNKAILKMNIINSWQMLYGVDITQNIFASEYVSDHKLVRLTLWQRLKSLRPWIKTKTVSDRKFYILHNGAIVCSFETAKMIKDALDN